MKNIIIVAAFALLSSCYHQDAPLTGLEGKPIPSFDLLLADSNTHLNTRSIPAGKPVVMCYIGTHCPYSRAEIQNIVDNITEFKDIRLYIFTSDPFKSMKGFYNHYGLSKYPNVTMGIDTTDTFAKYFQAKGVPYTAIYNKDKKLIKLYVGETDARLIRDVATD